MIPWEHLDSARIPGENEEVKLFRRGEEYSIRLGTYELMNSRMHGSEDALAQLACELVPNASKMLVGGLGMGFTLRAALSHAPDSCSILVSELIEGVIRWNQGILSFLAGDPLKDPRVVVKQGDVSEIIKAKKRAFDIILLDVDNGPDGLTVESNNWLYSKHGLRSIYDALRPGGILAVWSSSPDPGFTARLQKAKFEVEIHRVPARSSGKGRKHTIWLAKR
jgi:spermidine synthase